MMNLPSWDKHGGAVGQLVLKCLEGMYGVRWVNDVPKFKLPPKAFVKGIPWIGHSSLYHAPACLQMVAYKYGIYENLDFINFVMGFTYGAYLIIEDNDTYIFIPNSDPFLGFMNASRFIGLEYNLLVTNSKDVFVSLCRYLISNDIPVIIPVLMRSTDSLLYPTPHFVLLVGYEDEFFYVYEPLSNRYFLKFNSAGIKLALNALASAVEEYSRLFRLPWRYGLIYLTKSLKPHQVSLGEVLIRNGLLGIGSNRYCGQYQVLTGSKAIKALTKLIGDNTTNPKHISSNLLLISVMRMDNAVYLERFFANLEAINEVVSKLRNASLIYARTAKLLEKCVVSCNVSEITKLINEVVRLEEEAGLLMIKIGTKLLTEESMKPS